jgi:enolase-phosphatase E1
VNETVVLDIEGTAGSVAHVHEVLFPYARGRLAGWVAEHRGDPAVRRILAETGELLGAGARVDEATAVRALQEWSDQDRKAAPLKTLQGLVWAEGYARGELAGHVYPDSVAALDLWRERGAAVHVYSSGSVRAQQLWFGHTAFGDLRGRLTHYFDTVNAGPKKAAASYRTIAAALAVDPAGILFASDVAAELDAAAEAGWRTVLVARAEDGTRAPAGGRHPVAPDLVSVARRGTA